MVRRQYRYQFLDIDFADLADTKSAHATTMNRRLELSCERVD